MKKVAMVIIMALVLFVGVAYAGIYPTTMVIREIDRLNDLVICEDFNGNEWIFEGVEDWDIDDMVSMIMNDMDTETIKDDEIIMTRYSGYIEGF